MKPFRRALFACAVAGLVTATGCTSPENAKAPWVTGRGPEPVPRAQLPARTAPALPEPEWNPPAQPDAGSGVPLPTPLATVEWASPPSVLPSPVAPGPVPPTHQPPEWSRVPAPPVVTVERGN